MSLATRCPSCGTVFRVVQDQLKVSEGWVRCGRCDAVFNALEGLFDLERDAPPAWTPTPVPHPVAAASVPEAAHSETPHDSRSPDAPSAEAAHAAQVPSDHAGSASDAPPDPPWSQVNLAPADVPAPTPTPSPSPSPSSTPNFLREANRNPRWVGKRARFVTWVATALLLAGLMVQAIHHFRNTLSARWPIAKTMLTTWCHAVGCTVGAARRIEDINVENSALTRVAGPDSFRLAVALRNRGQMMLALPSLELSLTDSDGQLLARRALEPGDFRNGMATIAPGAEAALQLTLATGNPRVAGYTVEIFYP